MFNKNSRDYVRTFWPDGPDKTHDMKGIRKYYDEYTSGEYGEVDDQTFSDLTLDTLFEEVDGTYSSAGEAKLYDMLRHPVREQKKLDERSKIIEHFGENTNDRIDVQEIFYDLNKDKNFEFIDLLKGTFEGSKKKKQLFFVLGRILPIVFILLSVVNFKFLFGLIAVVIVNSMIAMMERNSNDKKPFAGIYYSSKIMKAAQRIKKLDIPVLSAYNERIDKALNTIGNDQRKFKSVASGLISDDIPDVLEPIIQIYATLVLQMENAYFSMIDNVEMYKGEIKDLYDIVGEIDGLIAVAGYKEKSEYKVSKPTFVSDDNGLEIINGAHPLVENVVKNSINISNKGIVLTGTNMSGKSTFLRMIGINIVLAQSFNFVHADKYKAPFLNVVSSISPDDDINSGKSYYMAEAEAVLRILKALDGKVKVFCAIDEIFRGTNPVERIAASEEILKYIQKRNSISIVATHDKELTDLLKETHNFYHFSERVSESSGLSFDYKLKSGILTTRNAIKLLKYIGYPDEIISGAYKSIGKK
ncbi:DNA mismatch repair protein MutS [uncultured Clostridium sp.]|jgi:DNA mismatch repair ATPase MutS|uniref:MutS-related protein n=1 Tax=uncultured Clostridium sp. TaxID=59620 RepID=UPI0026079742|nr:DNA mismatch repair protein MutS [uncultured Clostridium sp.]